MTTGIIDKKRLIFPGLAGLYETFSPASYSFIRFATGAVLVPQSIWPPLSTSRWAYPIR